MFRLFRFLGALCLAAAIASCAPRGEGPALWRIADADSEIWLFGTVHVLPPRLVWRTARIDAAFEAADTIVFETDVDAAGAAGFADLVQRHGTLPDGETLAARLDADGRARLARVIAQLNLNPVVLARARPWLAALQISLAFAQRSGSDPDAGVETVLAADARRAGKALAYLETPEQQIRALADLSPEAETRFLDATLRQIEDDSGESDALDESWARGNTNALAAQLDRLLREAGPEAYAAIVTTRNEAWANEIAAMLDGEGRVFVAVGAAHLVGDDSVVALLRARGVEVDGP